MFIRSVTVETFGVEYPEPIKLPNTQVILQKKYGLGMRQAMSLNPKNINSAMGILTQLAL